MKILFITLEPINSGSSAATVNVELIHGIIKNGHRVDVITLDSPCYSDEQSMEDLIPGCRIKKIGDTDIHSAAACPTKSGAFSLKTKVASAAKCLYRKLCIHNYTYLTVMKIRKNIAGNEKYDCVLSTSDPKTSHTLTKKLLKMGLHADRWIQYWGDPFSGDITRQCIYPEWVMKRIEKRMLSSADKVVYVSPLTAHMCQQQFPSIAEKLTFVPIPSVFNKIYPAIGEKKVYNIIYSGGYLSSIRDIMPLYEGCQGLNNIHLKIVGSTDLKLRNTENTEIIPPVLKKKATELEEASDLVVCMLNKSGTQIPAKLYHYMNTNKPILVLLDGEYKEEIKEYLESFHRFLLIDNTKDAVAEYLKTIHCNLNAIPCDQLIPEKIADQVLSEI